MRAGRGARKTASIDSRVNLKGGRFRSLRDSSRRLLFTTDWCASSPLALSRPLHLCALRGFRGSFVFAPCAPVAAPPFVRPLHSWSPGLTAQHTFLERKAKFSFRHPSDTGRHKHGCKFNTVPPRGALDPLTPQPSAGPGRFYRLAPPGRLKRVLKAHLHLGFILPALLHPGFFSYLSWYGLCVQPGSFHCKALKTQKSSVYHGRRMW